MRLAGVTNSARVSGLALGDYYYIPQGYQVTSEQFATDWKTLPYPVVTGERWSDERFWSDKWGYLRHALDVADWDAVARWYATEISDRLKRTVRATDYWDIATLNLQSHTSRALGMADKKAFADKVQRNFLVHDLGTKVGFGLKEPLYKVNQQNTYIRLAYNDGAGAEFSVGWNKEPTNNMIEKIVFGIIFAAITFGAVSAIMAPAAGTGAGAAGGAAAGGGAGGATVGTAGGISAGSAIGAAVPVGIEVVTVAAPALAVSAPIITAGSVAAGLAAGTVIQAASPPALQTNGNLPADAQAPKIDTAASGIEEVVTTAARVQPPIPIPTLAAIGASLTPVVLQPQTPTMDQPKVNQESDLKERVKDELKKELEKKGQEYVENYLAELLAQKLGRPATPQEIENYRDWMSDTPAFRPVSSDLSKYAPMILVFAAALLVVAAIRYRS